MVTRKKPDTPLQAEIRRRLAALGMSPRKASLLSGLNDTAIKAILGGMSNSPRAATLAAIARTLGCTVAELLGEEPPQPAHDESRIKDFVVKEIDVHAASGGGTVVETEPVNGAWSFPSAWARHEFRAAADSLRIITIEGDSMAGTLESGDKVLVDLSKTSPSPPGVFILHDGMGLVAKRLVYEPNSEPPRVSIRSDNPRYDPYERTSDEIRIIGRVVGVWRRM